MRAVHLTCHLVFHPKDKGKNSSDRHVKLFVNHLPRPRGVIDGAGKLWILEHWHAFFVRKFSNSERCFAAAPCDHQRHGVFARPIAQSDGEMGGIGNNHGSVDDRLPRSEEHTSEIQSLMRISYAVFCLKNKIKNTKYNIQSS